jgi:carbonic anhydrase/acetyltransferase-like protein (isoleucine patch superfamily)
MIQDLNGKTPSISREAFVHEAAVVIGDVVIGDCVNVWPGAVLRGDIERITVEDDASIQDGAMIHTDPGFPTSIGKGTTIAHGCIIHGCKIGDRTLIAMGAIVLTGAEVGSNSIIGAAALVPEGKKIPDRSIAMGVPAKVIRAVDASDIARIEETSAAYLRLMKRYKQ